MKAVLIGVAASALTLVSLSLTAAADLSVAQMQWQRRVLLLSSPAASDPAYQAQLKALEGWQDSAGRDVTVVRIEADAVVGSSDAAPALRARYALSANQFMAALIGKDGQVKLRWGTPVEPSRLDALIDAMPMRRSGQR